MNRHEFKNLSFRRARSSDVPELARLGMSAFRGPATEELWTRYYAENPHLPHERVLVAEREGRIAGSAALLDLRMAVDGKRVPIDGVAAVAVHLTARRQGVADHLMREAVRDAWSRRTPYSVLYAFRGSFYRRFGYAPVEMGHVLHAAPRELPDSPERRHVRRYEEDDRAAVERCYRAWTAGRTGPLERSAKWWEWRVLRAEQERVVYASPRTGRIEGYALGTLPETARLGQRRLRVQELVATTPRARRGLVAWLASLGEEFAAIDAHLAPEDSLAPFLRDPDYRAAPVLPQQETAGYLSWGAMARITHLEAALATRRARAARGALTLEIADALIPENRESITVRFGPARITATRGGRARLRVRAPVDVFTQVWLGAVSASQARGLGMLEGSVEAARLLDAACHGPAPFLGTLNEF